MRRILGILLAVAAAGAVPASADDGSAGSCGTVSLDAYGTVPALFYGALPDSLAGVLLRWQDACGLTEPIQRTRILAAIWDDAFDEWVYEDTIIDHLADYGPLVAAGRSAAADDPRERYDAFTVSLADQLLPHTRRGSQEAFFCLFYSGRVSEAWTLLRSDDLAGTWLDRLYENELELLQMPKPAVVVALTGGLWRPQGDLALVGDKPLVGALVGLRAHDWLARLVVEMRAGRSDTPYTVDLYGVPRLSDRFNATLVGVELGRILHAERSYGIDLFGGVYADAVKPFKDEDLVLGTVTASLGLGCRWFTGPEGNWMVGLDGRREWIADRNTAGTPLGGSAWSLRLSLGLRLDEGRGARLEALSP